MSQANFKVAQDWECIVAAPAAAVFTWKIQTRPANQHEWTADMIAGPSVSMGARISPDGRTLAFQARKPNPGRCVQPGHGELHAANARPAARLCQRDLVVPDGTKLYYDRTIGVPVGIYSIPALGGAERLVLDNAGSPEALPDGSLLVIRADSNARWRIYHFWPDSQRLQPLHGWVSIGTTIPLRVFPDGKEAVFNGMGSETDPLVHLYVIDIVAGKTRRLAPDLPDRRSSESYPIATSADNAGVLLEVPAGDLHRIVFAPLDGKGAIQTVMTLTRPPWYLDTAKDGTLYLDQVDRPHEILRFPVNGGHPELLGSSDTYVPAGQYMDPVETADGRFLLDTEFSGRGRVLIAKPGEDYVPLLGTNDETSSPATALGDNEVAFVLGSGSGATVVIVSTAAGRVIRWLQGTKGRHITALAASPDSKTIYFGADGWIWAIPTVDGLPRKIAAGENVGVDPNGRDLVLTKNVITNPSLTRVFLDGTKTQDVHLDKNQSMAPVPTGAHAINRQGKMLNTVSPSDSWFYRVAVLDLGTGQINPIKVTYPGDTLSPNWAADGRAISVGLPLKSHVWRFRPAGN